MNPHMETQTLKIPGDIAPPMTCVHGRIIDDVLTKTGKRTGQVCVSNVAPSLMTPIRVTSDQLTPSVTPPLSLSATVTQLSPVARFPSIDRFSPIPFVNGLYINLEIVISPRFTVGFLFALGSGACVECLHDRSQEWEGVVCC